MKKSLMTLLVLLGILLIMLASYWVYEIRVYRIRTQAVSNEVSSESSYVFSSPLCISAGSSEKQRINIVCLGGDGKGIANQNVIIQSNPDVKIDTIQGITDNKGIAIFETSCSKAKTIKLKVNCGNTLLDASASICCR